MKLYSVTTSLKIIAGTIGVSHDQLVGRSARLRVLSENSLHVTVEVRGDVEFKKGERVWLCDTAMGALPGTALSPVNLVKAARTDQSIELIEEMVAS
ncbi:hypothetical protein [uncultured Bradyrhizobium sp.]|uniref:hypothetical protein n=1 Tax=uncultured Bradyrhizobium sp. TaxID=199684 RepID=UPI00261CA635|nr:hypothetical protein [uncultured Bradyrhizobium sp.]